MKIVPVPTRTYLGSADELEVLIIDGKLNFRKCAPPPGRLLFVFDRKIRFFFSCHFGKWRPRICGARGGPLLPLDKLLSLGLSPRSTWTEGKKIGSC